MAMSVSALSGCARGDRGAANVTGNAADSADGSDTPANTDGDATTNAGGAPALADYPVEPLNAYIVLDQRVTSQPLIDRLRLAFAPYGDVQSGKFPDGSGLTCIAIEGMRFAWIGSYLQEVLDLRRALAVQYDIVEVWYRVNYDCYTITSETTFTVTGRLSRGAQGFVDSGDGYQSFDTDGNGRFVIDVPVYPDVPYILFRAVLGGAVAFGIVDVREPETGLQVVTEEEFERAVAERDAARRLAWLRRQPRALPADPPVAQTQTMPAVDDGMGDADGADDPDGEDGLTDDGASGNDRVTAPAPKVLAEALPFDLNLWFSALPPHHAATLAIVQAVQSAVSPTAEVLHWHSGRAFCVKVQTRQLHDIGRIHLAIADLIDARMLRAFELDRAVAVRLRPLAMLGTLKLTITGTVTRGTLLEIKLGAETVAVPVGADGTYSFDVPPSIVPELSEQRYVLARAQRGAETIHLAFDLLTGSHLEADEQDWLENSFAVDER